MLGCHGGLIARKNDDTLYLRKQILTLPHTNSDRRGHALFPLIIYGDRSVAQIGARQYLFCLTSQHNDDR